MKEYKSVAEGNKTSVDTDIVSKIAKTSQYFNGKISLAAIIAVFKEFDNFMVVLDLQTAVKISEYSQFFLNCSAEQDSLK
ncbi:hypothetical protein Barb6_02867 [Bacteroidales bacterium Barb6]|nr:hypothetical protein Barb6_02867 [Bacteroidales bacterium Barb6]